MPNKLKYILVLFIIILSVATATLLGIYLKQTKPEINLSSEIPSYTLKWNDKKNLEKLLSDLKVLDKGIYNNQSAKFESIGKINIILVPSPVDKFITGWKNITENAISGDYTIHDRQLDVKIYIINSDLGLKNTYSRDYFFNKTLVDIISYLTPTQDERRKNVPVYDPERGVKLIKAYFPKSMPITITDK